ncbi:YfbM family protein [Singulisphaera rosea]
MPMTRPVDRPRSCPAGSPWGCGTIRENPEAIRESTPGRNRPRWERVPDKGTAFMSITGRYLRLEEVTIREILAEPSSLLDVLYPDDESLEVGDLRLDIDKTWNILHYLLHDEPLGRGEIGLDCVLGGIELTPEDGGFGPARYLRRDEVRAIAEVLDRLTFPSLWSRYDPAEGERAELYWSDTPESEDYVRGHYAALQRFFSTARQEGQAVILWLA